MRDKTEIVEILFSMLNNLSQHLTLEEKELLEDLKVEFYAQCDSYEWEKFLEKN